MTVIYQCQNCFAEQEVTFVKCEPSEVVECDGCGSAAIKKIKEMG